MLVVHCGQSVGGCFSSHHQQSADCIFFTFTHTYTTHTHVRTFNSPLSGTTRVSRYQTGKTNLDFNEARDSEWQWHQLGHMQVCTSLQTDNHTSTPPLSFLQARCPSCRPTYSIKTLKAQFSLHSSQIIYQETKLSISKHTKCRYNSNSPGTHKYWIYMFNN